MERALIHTAHTNTTLMRVSLKIFHKILKNTGLNGVPTTTTLSIKMSGTSTVSATLTFSRKNTEENTEKMKYSIAISRLLLHLPNNTTPSPNSLLNLKKNWLNNWTSLTLAHSTLVARLDTSMKFVSATTSLNLDQKNLFLVSIKIYNQSPDTDTP